MDRAMSCPVMVLAIDAPRFTDRVKPRHRAKRNDGSARRGFSQQKLTRGC